MVERIARGNVRIRFAPVLRWLVVTTLISSGAVRAGGPSQTSDPWEPVRVLIGDWEGTVVGESGKGTVRRSYTLVLGNRFLHERNVTTYPPQPGNEKGEVHEHWSFLSYDRPRALLILRQFHQEGFVNRYALNRELGGPGRLVFDSEAFENLDSRWRARETYEIRSASEFVETFELAEPGGPLRVYSMSAFTKVRARQ
jgi:hypothetical protein